MMWLQTKVNAELLSDAGNPATRMFSTALTGISVRRGAIAKMGSSMG